ncbi:MAG: family 16 glycosylhydrolase [Phycisphaerae bacterium]
MRRCSGLVACACVLVFCSPLSGAPWNTIVFEDHFDGGTLDPAKWVINHPGDWWWVQGRTHFPDPDSTTGPFPHVDGGACVIEHHHYNPYHLGTPKTTFLGGEIHTVQEFAPNTSYRLEARVRNHSYPDGLVTSFFLYGYDGAASDEIDFEFLSKQINNGVTWPNGDPVLTNTWDESQQDPAYAAPQGLSFTDEWVTLRIYWFPSQQRVVWTWLDPVNGETELRDETASAYAPDEAMALYFNFWAATNLWPDAYDANLQPAQDLQSDKTYLYEIDYVEVRTPEPATIMSLLAGTAWILLRKKKVAAPCGPSAFRMPRVAATEHPMPSRGCAMVSQKV